MARNRSRRRGGRSRRGSRYITGRSGGLPQSEIFLQRGTLSVRTSVGVSLVSLLTPNASFRPVRYLIELAAIHYSFYQVQIYEGNDPSNALLRSFQGTISNGRRTIRGSWPRSVGVLSSGSTERSQNLIEIDHPCVASDLVGDAPLIYFVKVWFKRAGPTVGDSCPTIQGSFNPHLRAISPPIGVFRPRPGVATPHLGDATPILGDATPALRDATPEIRDDFEVVSMSSPPC